LNSSFFCYISVWEGTSDFGFSINCLPSALSSIFFVCIICRVFSYFFYFSLTSSIYYFSNGQRFSLYTGIPWSSSLSSSISKTASFKNFARSGCYWSSHHTLSWWLILPAKGLNIAVECLSSIYYTPTLIRSPFFYPSN